MSCDIFRYAGYGEESVFGTAVAAAFHTDITGATLDTPDNPNIVYTGGLGRAPRIIRPGYYSPSGNAVQGVDVDSMAYFLRWALGGYQYATDRHYIYGIDDVCLPSFTTRIGKDAYEHIFAGCKINTLEISAEDSIATVTLDMLGQKDSKGTLAAYDALSIGANNLLAFHEVTAKIKGESDVAFGDVSAIVKSLTLTINNNIDATQGRSIGSRFPRRLNAQGREVTLSLSLYFADTKYKEKFWGSASGASATDGTEEFGLQILMTQESGKAITFALPRCVITSNQQQPSARDELVEQISVTAMFQNYVADDGVPIDIDTDIFATIQNDVADLGTLS
jgi:hypothetical protein